MAGTETHYILPRPEFDRPVKLLIVVAPHYRDIADNLIAGARADADAVAAVRERLGLDDPVGTQFLTYVINVMEGDFGRSVVTRRPISEDIVTFFPATLELVILAACISLVLGVLLGVLAAVRSGTPSDVCVRGVAVLGLSVPDF